MFANKLNADDNENLFVLIVAFIDEYVRDRFRRRQSEAIYVTIANLSLPVLSDQSSKILICTAPPRTPRQELYDLVLIKPLLQLEEGLFQCHFSPYNKVMNIIGTLHCLIADDIGSRYATCKLGPNCGNPSRYYDYPPSQLGDFSFVEELDKKVPYLKKSDVHFIDTKLINSLNRDVCLDITSKLMCHSCSRCNLLGNI